MSHGRILKGQAAREVSKGRYGLMYCDQIPARHADGRSKLHPPAARAGRTKSWAWNRERAVLIVAVLIALAWFTLSEIPPEQAHVGFIRRKHDALIVSMVLSPDGMRMAMADSTGGVKLRDAESGWAIERDLPFAGFACALAFSPDGRFLAAGGSSSGITLYDLECDGAARSIPVPVAGVKTLAFSPDGRTVAVAAGKDARIFLWNLTAERMDRMLHPTSIVLSLAYSPDGRYLASGGRDDQSAVILWDPETGSSRLRLEGTEGPVFAMAFSPDGSLLATTSRFERRVRIRSVTSAARDRVVEGHRFGTNGVAFSPDGQTLATAGNDGMVRLWTVATGRQQAQAALDGYAIAMRCVAFSSSEGWLVATSPNDGDIRIWNLAEVGPR